VKNKVKIGLDPRNTQWSNDTSRFGHKHLERMGWSQGQGLGTGSSGREAMTSHIKVAIKTDNTGLGKKSSKSGSQGLDGEITTGMDVFQRILGKLNGKSQEDVDNQLRSQKQRMVMENSRFGMTFVYGGVLEGSVEKKPKEKITKHDKRKREENEKESESSSEEPPKKRREKDGKKDKKSKKNGKSKKSQDKSESKKSKKNKLKRKSEEPEVKPSQPSSGTSTPVLRGRQATRARWIAQKRAAVADVKGLNEILMITTRA
jgi:Pin2-interacting protein X1